MNVLTQEFQNMQEISDMTKFPFRNGLSGDVVKIVLQDFSNNIDDSLYFLSIGLWTFAEPQELDHGLRKDDFTDFKVDLVILEYIDSVDDSLDSNILENDYHEVDDFVLLLFSHL